MYLLRQACFIFNHGEMVAKLFKKYRDFHLCDCEIRVAVFDHFLRIMIFLE